MGARGPEGYLCMALHAHLPYVRHPEHPYFLEENWLYEAMTECYIPLLDMFSRLVNDRVDFRITVSLSPSLAEMLRDELLMQRYSDYVERLMELAERESRRNKGDCSFGPVVSMYQTRFRRIHYLFGDVYGRDLVSGFRQLQQNGHLEIIPSAATHAYLPHLSHHPGAVKAQIRIGLQQYRDNFGRAPDGIWFPECGFAPGFDDYIKEEGLSFFFLESHGIIRGVPSPRFGTSLPVLCRSGIAAFGRDAEASRQVWSSFGGYPGDHDYRDFYRDAGFDVDGDHVKAFLKPYGTKTFTGLKYYRITGNTDRKEPYNVQRAMMKAEEHAGHFIRCSEGRVRNLFGKMKKRPVITPTYDAELFGHWWFEGIHWLEALFRKMNRRGRTIRMISPSGYLNMEEGDRHMQISHPSASSWGEKGYHEVWLNDRNDYIYRHLLKAAERMTALADRFAHAEGILRRALNQAAREILLSQHSDWTFMIKNDSDAGYARNRFQTHIGRFAWLYDSILSGNLQESRLAEIEDRDRIFPNIDYRVYRSMHEKAGRAG